MVIAFSSMGFAFHPSNLTSSGSQSFAETQGDSKGRSPWRFFGDFLIGEKVTRVQGGAPASGGVQRGAAPRMVGAGTMSLQNPPGRGAERPHLGRSAEEGPGPPRKEASECPSAERKRGREEKKKAPIKGDL